MVPILYLRKITFNSHFCKFFSYRFCVINSYLELLYENLEVSSRWSYSSIKYDWQMDASALENNSATCIRSQSCLQRVSSKGWDYLLLTAFLSSHSTKRDFHKIYECCKSGKPLSQKECYNRRALDLLTDCSFFSYILLSPVLAQAQIRFFSK